MTFRLVMVLKNYVLCANYFQRLHVFMFITVFSRTDVWDKYGN